MMGQRCAVRAQMIHHPGHIISRGPQPQEVLFICAMHALFVEIATQSTLVRLVEWSITSLIPVRGDPVNRKLNCG